MQTVLALRFVGAAAASVLIALASAALADHPPQQFRLDESIAETVIACREETAAVQIIRALAARNKADATEMAQHYGQRGVCRRLTSLVTYRQRVFAEHAIDGLWTVYAVDIHDGSRWYVLMLNWTHERAL